MITKMSHTTIFVLDQAEAFKFYTGKLGFEVRTDFTMDNGFRWLTVGPKAQPDLEIVLMQPTPGPMLDEESAGHIRWLLEKGVLGAGVFQTDDCRATYEELKAKGVEFKVPPADRFYGVEAIFRDNSGNWFSLTEPKEHQEQG